MREEMTRRFVDRRWGRGLSAVVLAAGCDSQADPSYVGEAMIELAGRIEAAPESRSLTAAVGVLWLMGSPEDGCSGPKLGCSTSASGAASVDSDFECVAACGEQPQDCTDAAAYQSWAQCQTECGVHTEVVVQVESRTCFEGGVAQTTPVDGEFPAGFELDVLEPPPDAAVMASDTGERVAVGMFVAVAPEAETLTFSRKDDEPPGWLRGGSETHVLIYAAEPVAAESSWGRHLGGAYSEGYHLARVVPGNRCGLPRYDEAVGDEGEYDYSDVPLVCGNGACEASEDCSVCADCIECDADGNGTDSGLSNVENDAYYCLSTPGRLVPAGSGSEQDIELLLMGPEYIAWPPI